MGLATQLKKPLSLFAASVQCEAGMRMSDPITLSSGGLEAWNRVRERDGEREQH